MMILAAPAGAGAQARRRARFDQRGDITLASNSIMTCRPGTTASDGTTCAAALAGGLPSDNDYPMIPIDTDGDASTFDSSSSDLVLPAGASVTWAGLYWQCHSGGAPTPAARNVVRFRAPGGTYATRTATVLDTLGAGGVGLYQGFVEVTADVRTGGPGTYTVADIQCDSGTTNHFGGWTLVVVYANPADPLRDLVVFDVFQAYGTTAIDVAVSGFVTPPFGIVSSRVGVVIYDGDRIGGPSLGGTGGDTVRLISGISNTLLGDLPLPGAVNPNNDFGNGSITRFGANVTTRAPAAVNTLGYDSDLFATLGALPNSATTATIRLQTSGESIDVGVVTFATDIFAPDIALVKNVRDVNGGALQPNDVLEYTVVATNNGMDPALDVRLTDVIPTGTTYVPGSITIDGASRTDATGDDTAEFIAGTTTIQARLGTGASATVGGRMNPTATTTIVFRVRVGTLTAGQTITNTANATYTGLTLGAGTTFTGTSDGDPVTGGPQPTVIVVGAICGDSTITAPESCDDGNTTGSDGCSAGCRREVSITSPDGGSTSNATPPIVGRGDPGALVTVTIDGVTVGTVTTDASGNWTLTPAMSLAEGPHTIGASAVDSLGVTSTDTSTVTIDTTTSVAITSPASGSGTSDSTPTISGTGEPGAMVTIVVDGGTIGTVVVAADGTWTIDVTTPLGDGPHTARADAVDAAGNTATATSSFAVDTTTTVDVTGPTEGSTVATRRPAISGTGEAGATVLVTVDGTTIGTTTVAADGTWSVTPTSDLTNGSHTAVATATDAVGNTAVDSATFTVMAGTFVSIDAPADGALLTDTTPTLSGTGEPGATIVVTVDGVSVGTTTVAADGTWSVTPATALADGSHTVVATATNGSGDTAMDTSSFTVDSTTRVDFRQPGGSGAIGDTTPELSGTAEPGASVEVTIDGSVVGTVTADSEGNWTIALGDPLDESEHDVSVTATDEAGNTATDTGSFTVDTTQPAIELRGPGDQTHTSDTTPTISGDTEPGLLVIVLVDGTMVGTAVADEHGHWTLELTTPLASGDHEVLATTTDAAGNTAEDAHEFTIDTTAPAVDVTGPADGSAGVDTTPTITGTAEPGSTVEVFVDGVRVGTVTAADDGTWSVPTTTTLDDGTHTVRAVTEDTAGNTATDSGSFVVDTATTVAITQPSEGSTVGTPRPLIVGRAEPGATVEVSIDGVVLGTVTAAADGSWSIPTTSDLAAGDHTVTADATDELGNTADASATFTVDLTMLDTDGDGILDVDECPTMPCRDTDSDGTPDFQDPDDDGDGIGTLLECGTTPCPDHDGDGLPDYRDPDDDGDGIPTEDEAPASTPRDTDRDGTPDHLDVDDDGDGLPTMTECTTPASCVDNDGDGAPDFIDPDDDDDGISTARERADGMTFGDDVDGDGLVNWLDVESDGDGALDEDEGVGDADDDGTPNYLDADGVTPDAGVPDAGRDAGGAGDGGVGDGSVDVDSGIGPHAPGGFSGGACNCSVPGASSRSTSSGALLLLLGAALMIARRRRRALTIAALSVLALATPSAASAQGFTLDQFRPAETSNDGFALSRPNDLGHLNFGAQLVLDYAHDPLVYEERLGDMSTQSRRIVEHQLVGTVGLSLGLFDRVVIFAGLPVSLWSDGSGGPGFPTADGTAVGDPYLGVRVRLFGELHDAFALGVQVAGTAPLGDAVNGAQTFTGERGFTFLPRLMGEIRLIDERLRVDLNVGARVRDQSDVANLRVGHELTYGIGVTAVVVPSTLDLTVEGYGATAFDDFFGRSATPFEIIGGARIHPICGMTIGAAAGGGVTRGYGSPNFRAILSVGFAYDATCAEPQPEPEVVDAPPPTPGDTDHDGILDDVDECPSEPEDVDTFEDANGCPDIDNDRDGVLDVDDAAPLDPEDPDGFEDTDGVPDPDNDHDGILDVNDGCPLEPEDVDTFEDTNGCPDVDNDQDTVLDVDDQCPLTPGTVAAHGCSEAVRLDTETGTIVILQRVEFATNRDVILERSFPILVEVAAVLQANPQLTRIRIEGHTDDRGRDARNLELSRRRASSVQRWLVEHGIDESRFEAWGCGELHPIESNRSADGRQANRRVEFHIVAPAPSGGLRQLEGCVEAE